MILFTFRSVRGCRRWRRSSRRWTPRWRGGSRAQWRKDDKRRRKSSSLPLPTSTPSTSTPTISSRSFYSIPDSFCSLFILCNTKIGIVSLMWSFYPSILPVVGVKCLCSEIVITGNVRCWVLNNFNATINNYRQIWLSIYKWTWLCQAWLRCLWTK